MVENYNNIEIIIEKYIRILKENYINIEKAFLFGSYARKNASEDSDIDIALVSADFSGSRFYDRRKIIPLRRNIDNRLEPIPFRPEDFTMNDPLVIEIINTGIELNNIK
jgi:uncharacterized protein